MDKENAATNVRRRSGSSASGRSKSASARRKTQTRRKTSGTRRKTSGGSDIAAVIARLPKPVLAGAVALIVLIIIIVFAAKGCGVSHKTPERVVRTLIESYTGGNESKVKKCYGVSKADDTLQQEMDATVKYFSAFEAEKRNHIRQDQSEQIHSPGALGHPDRGLHGDNFRNPGRTDRRRGTPVFPGAEGAVYECRRRRCRRGQTGPQ